MGENRDFWNNNKTILGFYPRADYNKYTLTKDFTEFAFDGEPLMKSHSDIPTTVYSVMNDKSFDYDITVVLDNKMIESIVGAGDVSQTSFFSNYIKKGTNLKTDYVFRLYKFNGFEYKDLCTKVVVKIKQSKQSVTLTLGSRVTELKDSSGLEAKTPLAGWPENSQFNESFQALIKNTDIEYTGDTSSVDFHESTGESSLDVKEFPNSTGAFIYDNDEILISNISNANSSKYGTKYNFVADTIENFGLDQILHYSFNANNGDRYLVVEYPLSTYARVGQYTALYLLKESDLSIVAVLGYGRVAENVGSGLNQTSVSSLVGSYVKDLSVDATSSVSLQRGVGDGCYHYLNTTPNDDGYRGYLGQVVQQGDYFMPIFGICETALYNASDIFGNKPFMRLDTSIYFVSEITASGNSRYVGSDINANFYDTFHGVENNATSRVKINESIKSRSYFLYDDVNDRLIFQRASDSAPNTTSYEMDGGLEKSWNNFGLNPIGYYSLTTDTLGYIDKNNDSFIQDWVYDSGKIYASSLQPHHTNYEFYRPPAEAQQYSDIIQMDATSGVTSIFSTVKIEKALFPYGLHIYDNKISYIYMTLNEWHYIREDITTNIATSVIIGDYDDLHTVTGSVLVNDSPVLIVFSSEGIQVQP